MSTKTSPLLYIGGAAAVYFLFLKPKAAPAPVFIPGTNIPAPAPVSTNPLSNLFPVISPVQSTVTNYGINSGIKGGNGSFYTVNNYAQLLAANPNLGNPNYTLSPAESSQYLANYSDLQTGLPTWVGQKMLDGTTASNLSMAIQGHWRIYGCAEKRIYLPLQPPSTAAFIPPPANPKSSGGGSSVLGTALGVATSILPLLLGVDTDPRLSNAEIQVLMTGGAILNDILPLYVPGQPVAAKQAQLRLSDLITQYS